MNTTAEAPVRRWVSLYRSFGLQPLPSDPRPESEGGRKKPLVRFADWWEADAPAGLFDSEAANRHGDPNVQVMCGTHWGLCVLDLDGPEAVALVDTWPRLPRTWTVWHSDGGRKSRHLWFRTPRGAGPKGKTVLWGDWDDAGNPKPHTAVELLCDRSLVMAPPSVHPRTGRRYGFVKGRSPFDCPLAALPDWVWRMPPAESPRAREEAPAPAARPVMAAPTRAPAADWRHVLDGIVDKAAVAARWGLRLAGARPSKDGWVPCHDFGRKDANPSASFNVISGRFWRPGMGRNQTLSLFELGVALGWYPDWRTCCNDLAGNPNFN